MSSISEEIDSLIACGKMNQAIKVAQKGGASKEYAQQQVIERRDFLYSTAGKLLCSLAALHGVAIDGTEVGGLSYTREEEDFNIEVGIEVSGKVKVLIRESDKKFAEYLLTKIKEYNPNSEFIEAKKLIVNYGKPQSASSDSGFFTSMLQRRLNVPYSAARKFVEQFFAEGGWNTKES